MNFRKHYDRMKWQMTKAVHSTNVHSFDAAREQEEWELELEKRRKESVSKPRGFLRGALR
jgi:hypothetical protein